MNLTLYINKSQPNVLIKKIAEIVKIETIEPYDEVTILNPVFIINYDKKFLDCNYIYCLELNRYYYVTASINIAKRIVLTGSIDPLMSFKDQILQSYATILRSESIGEPTVIPDNQLPINTGESQILVQGGFKSLGVIGPDTDGYIITTLGG